MSTGGQLIAEARRRAGLTQRELAARLGTSQPAVARWERGGAAPSVDRVIESLHACGFDLTLGVVPLDDHDLSLARRCRRLGPDERLDQAVRVAGLRGLASPGTRAAPHRPAASPWGAAARSGPPRADHVRERPDDAAGSFRPRRMLRVLAEHRAEFVVIGGLAAVLHGAPHTTVDLDVCPRPGEANLRRLASALTALGARLPTGTGDLLPFRCDAAFLAGVSVLNTTTRAGDLDVCAVPSGTGGYADLRRSAELVELHDEGTPITVRVAALADVVRSKEAAGREKDRAALHVLRRLLRERERGEP